jgi:hypothetical protein
MPPKYQLTISRDDPADKQAQGRIGDEDQPSPIEAATNGATCSGRCSVARSLRIARLNEEGAATQKYGDAYWL